MERIHLNNRASALDFIFWLVAIVVLTLYNLTPSIGGFDVSYYFLAGEHFWNGQIDCLRTPVYPLLLKLFNVWFGNRGGVAGIIVLQSIVYLLSVASLRSILQKVCKNKLVQTMTALLYVVCVAPGWCNEMLTESLSISGCIIIADLLCRYIQKTSYQLSIGIFLISLVLVFLRPTFVFLFAILPFVWFILWIRKNRRTLQCTSLLLTAVCVCAYWGYCKAYEKEYGVFTSSISFVCNDVYNMKRSGVWDTDKVIDPQARKILNDIDEKWDGNYDPIYQAVDSNHKCLSLIAKGCKDIKSGSEKTLISHQLKNTAASFDKRFNASVNTHTHLSTVLFVSSLFLALPLWLFYCTVVASVLTLIIYFIRKRTIPLTASVIVLFVLAQCAGILLFASEAHERLFLPVYPLFLVLLGMTIVKSKDTINNCD